jgi:site-specific DNA recombinase
MCATPMVMAAGGRRPGGDVLAVWAQGLAGRRGEVRGRGSLQFAFYGRVSTEDWQDPVTSRTRQLQQAVMLVAGHGVIAAEVGGRVDWHAEDHEETMLALGLSSKREITRTRVRVRTARAAQTREQGRYLGGRPPYGYRLGDAGPHPNKAHAAWGWRAHRLEPDPETEHVVRWMFSQRLAGHSAARITRALNDAGVPCPSAADPARNPHRAGTGWTLRTVAAILANPRYTGRQVWNRQPSEAVLVDPANTGLGHKQVQRWNLPEGWVISRHPAHTALVSEADFIAAQDATAPRGPAGPAVRLYLLAGLLACGRCGRRLESAWSNGRPAYRCRHGYSSATVPDPARPKNTYVREDQVLPHLAALAILLAGDETTDRARPAGITAPAQIADLIDELRATGTPLTYDPDTRTIRAGDDTAVAITAGQRS